MHTVTSFYRFNPVKCNYIFLNMELWNSLTCDICCTLCIRQNIQTALFRKPVVQKLQYIQYMYSYFDFRRKSVLKVHDRLFILFKFWASSQWITSDKMDLQSESSCRNWDGHWDPSSVDIPDTPLWSAHTGYPCSWAAHKPPSRRSPHEWNCSDSGRYGSLSSRCHTRSGDPESSCPRKTQSGGHQHNVEQQWTVDLNITVYNS